MSDIHPIWLHEFPPSFERLSYLDEEWEELLVLNEIVKILSLKNKQMENIWSYISIDIDFYKSIFKRLIHSKRSSSISLNPEELEQIDIKHIDLIFEKSDHNSELTRKIATAISRAFYNYQYEWIKNKIKNDLDDRLRC